MVSRLKVYDDPLASKKFQIATDFILKMHLFGSEEEGVRQSTFTTLAAIFEDYPST